jgi:hypothetical protein
MAERIPTIVGKMRVTRRYRGWWMPPLRFARYLITQSEAQPIAGNPTRETMIWPAMANEMFSSAQLYGGEESMVPYVVPMATLTPRVRPLRS